MFALPDGPIIFAPSAPVKSICESISGFAYAASGGGGGRASAAAAGRRRAEGRRFAERRVEAHRRATDEEYAMWCAATDAASGDVYYYHAETGATSWTWPPEKALR